MNAAHPECYDLVIIGGGMAGVCAAIAAARHGCRTALVHDRPVLGGNSSSEIRMHVCGADYYCDGLARRETGIIEELRLADCVRNPQRSASMWDLLLHEWVCREPKLDLFLNALAVEPVMATPHRIAAVRVHQLASERSLLLTGELFADCSGDGRIAAQAGAEHRIGREARSEYDESMANEEADAFTLGSSLLFTARDMGRPMPFIKPDWAHSYPTDADLSDREHEPFRYGFWWIEWGGELDTISDNERIRDELLRIALGVWDHIKNHGDHGAENWALDWVGFLPGKRESRRFLGDVVLTQQDLESGRVFKDEVAYGGWPIDVHPIGGIRSDTAPCTQIQVPLYSIPLRALYSRNLENLFFAGRNASATHIAFASTRVMATCALMGQAVGTAAAVCREHDLLPCDAAREHIGEIQQRLLADDAFLLGQQNADTDDLARTARITAGSHLEETPPNAVADGISRPTDDALHCWESRSLQPEDAWLQLEWPEPRPLGRLQVAFDSELEKRLMLTQETHLYEKANILSALPARLVRDFEVAVQTPDGWREVASVKDNTQRQQQISLDAPAATTAIRLRFARTWGHPRARVFEVRAYA